MGAMSMMNNNAPMASTPEQRKLVDDGFDAFCWTAIAMPERQRRIGAYQAFTNAGGGICLPMPDDFLG